MGNNPLWLARLNFSLPCILYRSTRYSKESNRMPTFLFFLVRNAFGFFFVFFFFLTTFCQMVTRILFLFFSLFFFQISFSAGSTPKWTRWFDRPRTPTSNPSGGPAGDDAASARRLCTRKERIGRHQFVTYSYIDDVMIYDGCNTQWFTHDNASSRFRRFQWQSEIP